MKATKKQAEKTFMAEILPAVKKQYEQDGRKDMPARSESWACFTDSLCKDGKISLRQYETWQAPKCCR